VFVISRQQKVTPSHHSLPIIKCLFFSGISGSCGALRVSAKAPSLSCLLRSSFFLTAVPVSVARAYPNARGRQQHWLHPPTARVCAGLRPPPVPYSPAKRPTAQTKAVRTASRPPTSGLSLAGWRRHPQRPAVHLFRFSAKVE